MRELPDAGALILRGRSAVRKILFGLVLVVPASAMVGLSGPRAARESDPLASRRAVVESQAREAVSQARVQQYVDRERAARAARFAVRFQIPALLANDIYWAATRERIDPQVAFRLVSVESSFRPWAVSPVGAVGLTQVMPETAKWLFPETRDEDLLVSRYNLRVGFSYLRLLLDTYRDTRLALLAYNRGPGTVDALVEAGIDPANGYAHFILTGDRKPLVEHLERQREAALTSGDRRGS